MYQFLFEANAWKYLWRVPLEAPPVPYHCVTAQSFGANSDKLRSIDFSAIEGKPSSAIDRHVCGHIAQRNPRLVRWGSRQVVGVARPTGFEPVTSRLGSECSIQLSYGRIVESMLLTAVCRV